MLGLKLNHVSKRGLIDGVLARLKWLQYSYQRKRCFSVILLDKFYFKSDSLKTMISLRFRLFQASAEA